MPGELPELRRRKEELLICSEANRRVLSLELEPVRIAMNAVDGGIEAARNTGLLNLWPTVMAGVGIVNRLRRPGKDSAMAECFIRLIDTLGGVIRRLYS